jgi:hypothetical protein
VATVTNYLHKLKEFNNKARRRGDAKKS